MTVLSPITFEQIVEGVAAPCDNAESEWCPKGEAEWSALVRCPDCRASKWELWCDGCHDLVLVTEDGFECALCEALVFPARGFVASFERLSK